MRMIPILFPSFEYTHQIWSLLEYEKTWSAVFVVCALEMTMYIFQLVWSIMQSSLILILRFDGLQFLTFIYFVHFKGSFNRMLNIREHL